MSLNKLIKKHIRILETPIYSDVKSFFDTFQKESCIPIAFISNPHTLLPKNIEPTNLNNFFINHDTKGLLLSINLNLCMNLKEIVHTCYHQLNHKLFGINLKKYKTKDDFPLPHSFDILYEWLAANDPLKANDALNISTIYLTIQCNLHSNDHHYSLLKDFFHTFFKPQPTPGGIIYSFRVTILSDFFDFRPSNQTIITSADTSPDVQISSKLLDILEPSNFDVEAPTFATKLFTFPPKERCFETFFNVVTSSVENDYGDHRYVEPGPELIGSLKKIYFQKHTADVYTLWRLLKYATLKHGMRYFTFLEEVNVDFHDFSHNLDSYMDKVYAQATQLVRDKGNVSKESLESLEVLESSSEPKVQFRKKLRDRNKFGAAESTKSTSGVKPYALDALRAFTPSFKTYVEGLVDGGTAAKKRLITIDHAFTKFFVECSAKIVAYRVCLKPCLSVLRLFCRTLDDPSGSLRDSNLVNLYLQTSTGKLAQNPTLSKSLANLSTPTLSVARLTHFVTKCLKILDDSTGPSNEMAGPLLATQRLILRPYAGMEANAKQEGSDGNQEGTSVLAQTVKMDNMVRDVTALITSILSDHLVPVTSLVFHELYYIDGGGNDENFLYQELYPSPTIDVPQSFDHLLSHFQRNEIEPKDHSLVYTATAYQTAITDKGTSLYTRKIKLLDWFEAFGNSIRFNYKMEIEGGTEPVEGDNIPDLGEAFKQALVDLKYMGLAKPRKKTKKADNSRYWDVTIVNFS